MRSRAVMAIAFGFVLGFATFLGVDAAYASWTSNYCSTANGESISPINRAQAATYALSADGDGYEWGGGCWNGNGVDDTPGAPDSGGEGPDCSGFVFKTWKLSTNMNNSGWYGWSKWENIHGPYSADSIRQDLGPAIVDRSTAYSSTVAYDAFASTSHTGMIYGEDSGGFDWIAEAKSDAVGTGVWMRDYRSNIAYDASARVGWATGCTNCS